MIHKTTYILEDIHQNDSDTWQNIIERWGKKIGTKMVDGFYRKFKMMNLPNLPGQK